MIDPRENTAYDPRQELKEKLQDCGYPFECVEKPGITMVKFNLPTGHLQITIKQALRKPMADIKALIDAAMNQDEIISNVFTRDGEKIPFKKQADREADME